MTPEQVKEVQEELGLNVQLPAGVVYAQMIGDLIAEAGYDSPQIHEPQDIALPKVYYALKAILEENAKLKGK